MNYLIKGRGTLIHFVLQSVGGWLLPLLDGYQNGKRMEWSGTEPESKGKDQLWRGNQDEKKKNKWKLQLQPQPQPQEDEDEEQAIYNFGGSTSHPASQ